MRITQGMMNRNYLNRMSTNLNNLSSSNNKLASQRKFDKSYENVTDAGKALKARKLVADNERYLSTIRDSNARATAAEDAIRSVNSLLVKLEDRVVQGLNGTYNADDREKIATELEAVQNEIFQIMNLKFSDKYIFNAAGSVGNAAPFTKDAGGSLMYNGTYVDSMYKNTTTGKPNYTTTDSSGNPVSVEIPYNTDNYVDIGFGFDVSSGSVNPNTAFKNTYSGVECFGYGTNADGIPVNAYSLVGQMADSLRANDMATLRKTLDGLGGTMNALLTAVTDIGARVNTLESSAERIEGELINLYEMQNSLEGIDLSEEIIYNKQFEMSWMVTLQLGSKILPSTLFDFMR